MYDIKELIKTAKEIAEKNFCCNYSNYTVGAVLVAKSGKKYTGFNIENHGIQSICAERVAFCKALSDMEKEFECIVVVGKNMKDKNYTKTLPCGYCRQFISNYSKSDFMIHTYDDEEKKIYSYKISELLPESFKFN